MPTSYAAGTGSGAVAIGDFDGDGLLDVVAVGGGTVSVLLNQPSS